jgi:hypothetical protein
MCVRPFHIGRGVKVILMSVRPEVWYAAKMTGDVKSKGEDAEPTGSAPIDDKGADAAAANHETSEVYEACMRAYRWMSRRYRKTLDALAK